MKFNSCLLIFVLALFFLSCGKSETFEEVTIHQGQSSALLDVYFKSMSSFKTQVFYEEGAEPYTGYRLNGKPRWGLFIKNIGSLLKATERGITLDIPKTLSEMTKLPLQNKTNWSGEDIYNLVESQNAQKNSSSEGVIHILFLNGNFEKDGVINSSVMGVHLTNTTIIAIFKDKIKAVQSSQGNNVAMFTEQSVLVHEFGHAMGLVNNGVSIKSQHHDSEHGAHCTVQNCVMYYLNEGASDLQEYIQNYITTGDEDLFGPHCLQDAANYN